MVSASTALDVVLSETLLAYGCVPPYMSPSCRFHTRVGSRNEHVFDFRHVLCALQNGGTDVVLRSHENLASLPRFEIVVIFLSNC